MPICPVPQRHWRSYGTEPLPPASEALNQPFRAFPSWFLHIECERCGKATCREVIVDVEPRRASPGKGFMVT